tara:strand:- start:301 stop:846 length:546 start_codon:yes stop_codon:yes gene_type:complete
MSFPKVPSSASAVVEKVIFLTITATIHILQSPMNNSHSHSHTTFTLSNNRDRKFHLISKLETPLFNLLSLKDLLLSKRKARCTIIVQPLATSALSRDPPRSRSMRPLKSVTLVDGSFEQEYCSRNIWESIIKLYYSSLIYNKMCIDIIHYSNYPAHPKLIARPKLVGRIQKREIGIRLSLF